MIFSEAKTILSIDNNNQEYYYFLHTKSAYKNFWRIM